MNWKKAVGYGAALWVLMFVIVSVFVGFKIWGSTWLHVVTAFIAGVVSFVLAGYAKPAKASAALSYGISWAVVSAILDIAITMRFDSTVFAQWPMWLGYALIILAPLLRVKKSESAPPAQPMV